MNRWRREHRAPAAAQRPAHLVGNGTVRRLLLVLAVVAGLVLMHHVVSSAQSHCDGGGAGAAVIASPPAGTGGVAGATSGPARSSITPFPSKGALPANAVVSSPGGELGEHAWMLDVLHACLAMLLAAGALLVHAHRLSVGAPDPRQRLRSLSATSWRPTRGPPMARRLAQLQVLRL